jgi:predicted negative regulator of RcsB-dependent stress response
MTSAGACNGGGKQDEVLEIFRNNIQKNPGSWIAHIEPARLDVAKKDYDAAITQMKLALSVAPDKSLKSQLTDLVRRLENKEDINR